MTNPFFDHPILNSPYDHPRRHWELDDEGQPSLTAWPGELVCAEGRYKEGETERRAGVFIGPEFGTVNRPDLLASDPKDITAEFERGFAEMTSEPVALSVLVEARARLFDAVVARMPDEHRKFLISFALGAAVC